VLAGIRSLTGKLQAAEPRLDGILSLKGVMEVTEQEEHEQDRAQAEAAVIAGFEQTVADLRPSGHVLLSRSRCCSKARAASIPIACTRKLS
jgi:uncharacterized protein YicC (UPF0701 family)